MEIVLEITRKCNLNCHHCLRGDPENKDFQLFEQLDLLFKALNKFKNQLHLDSLLFTGGEPLLNIDGISKTFDILKRNNIFLCPYIITNGTIEINNILTYLKEISEYYEYFDECIDDNIEKIIGLSESEFHQISREELNLKINPIFKLLKTFSKANKINEENYEYILPIGRGEYIGTNYYYYNTIIETTKSFKLENLFNEEFDYLYISSNGKIFNECNLSYEMMDEPEEYDFPNITLNELIDFLNSDNTLKYLKGDR